MSNRLEELLIKLYTNKKDSFYSHLFFQVDRQQDNKNCPTLGVGVQDGRIKLYYNSDFLATLSNKEAIEILKHEGLHLINQHLLRGKGMTEKDMTKHKMENIAMDMAINQYLDNKVIEKIGGVNMKSFTKLLKGLPKGFQIEEKQTWEYYYSLIEQEKQHREDQGDKGEQGQGDGQGSPQGGSGGFEKELEDMVMDDHGQFKEMDALDQAMLEDKIKKAAESARADGAGQLPSEVEELLKLMKKPTISWQRELKQFMGQTARADRTTTRSRRNRRYGITFAGHKRDYTAKILVVLDSSGSMYGSRTDKVLSEIYGIYKATPNLALDIVECDTNITDVFTYEGKDEFKVTGRGGTQLCPALIYAKENKYDGIVVLSDGEYYGEDFKANDKLPSIWVIAENKGFTSEIGRTIHI